jgi:FMN-dependent NADH-azoreductase
MSAKLLKEINQRIKEEGNIEEIVELDLGDLRIPAISDDIKKLLDKAKNLEILILADNDLENVNNLPKLDLTVLELSSNK